MKLRTIIGIGLAAGMTMFMGAVANAATMWEFGTPVVDSGDVEVPIYLESNEITKLGAYDIDVLFDNTKMTYDGSENKIKSGRSDLGAITEDTSFLDAGQGRVGLIWTTNKNDTTFTNKINIANIYFKLSDTSMTADDVLSTLAVRPQNITFDGTRYRGTVGTYVTFTMDKDFVPTTTNKYIVGMALDIDGEQYSESDGTLKYTEDADGNYVFTVTMKPSAKTTADVKLIGKVAATEDSTDTTDVVLNDFGTVSIENATPFED